MDQVNGYLMKKSRNSSPFEDEERPYRNIIDAASDGLVIYDIEMDVVVEANPAACEMHGYTRALAFLRDVNKRKQSEETLILCNRAN
jgi:PAS domain-containing protein